MILIKDQQVARRVEEAERRSYIEKRNCRKSNPQFPYAVFRPSQQGGRHRQKRERNALNPVCGCEARYPGL